MDGSLKWGRLPYDQSSTSMSPPIPASAMSGTAPSLAPPTTRGGAVLASEHRREFVTIIGVLRERAFQDAAEVVIPAP
jgi:hypothetical protein